MRFSPEIIIALGTGMALLTGVVGRCQAQPLARSFAVVGYTHGKFDGRTRQAICLDKDGALAKVKTDQGHVVAN